MDTELNEPLFKKDDYGYAADQIYTQKNMDEALAQQRKELINKASGYLEDLEMCGDIQMVNPWLTWEGLMKFAMRIKDLG